MVILSIEEEKEVDVEEDESGSMRDPQKDLMEEWKEDSPMVMEEKLKRRDKSSAYYERSAGQTGRRVVCVE